MGGQGHDVKSKSASPARKRSPKAVAGGRSAAAALEPLVLELFGVVKETLNAYGVTAKKQRQLYNLAQRSRRVNRVSEPLLHEHYKLAYLIETWREEAPYIDERGQPRVLQIRGPGATFESLCKRFNPDKTVGEIVQFACRAASVGTLSEGRVALYGDAFVDLSHSPETTLAQTILHVTRVMDTCLHNARRLPGDRHPGRMERHIHGRLSVEEFESLQEVIRPQVQDLCERVDRLLQSRERRHGGKKAPVGAAGLGIYLYHYGEGEQTVSLRRSPRR
jgi:hypothetical protein